MRKMFSFNLMHHRILDVLIYHDSLYKDGKCSGHKPSSFKQDQYKIAETTNSLPKAEYLQRIAVSECHLLQDKLKA